MAHPPDDSSHQGDRAPPRVLVVDDTPANRDVLSRRVQREGYLAETAENGREALEKLRAGPFDLVLLDVQMPEMDGPQLLEVLRTARSCSRCSARIPNSRIFR